MTYIGMVIDKSVSDDDYVDVAYWQHMVQVKADGLCTWPGERVADKLICKVC